MGKKKSRFTRLFISEPKPEKNHRRRRSTMQNEGTHAVAIATAAAVAAEAAIAAANAAAEVARLTNISHELRRKKLHSAAMKIQACCKGYLARKALSALKGVVKLQAVVRGELARRHIIKKLTFTSLWEPCEKKIPATLGTTNLARLKLRNAIKQTSPLTHRRLLFRLDNDRSTRDDYQIFPGYMATTESAKAKAKPPGFSSTLNRCRRLPDSYSCQDSPSKLSISSGSSLINIELIKCACKNGIRL